MQNGVGVGVWREGEDSGERERGVGGRRWEEEGGEGERGVGSRRDEGEGERKRLEAGI